MLGAKLGQFEILDRIGSGGMGDVYRARDTKLHREVAIKVLGEKLSPLPERIARFEREAHVLASLNHPNIATLHGLEESDGVEFLVMELVDGETLAQKIARESISLEEARSLFEQIARGLEAAHEKGIVHRDLKPSNVQITPSGQVKILDFGLAKVFAPEEAPGDLSQSPTLTREGTKTGVVLGTAAYMSPEQARGGSVDKRTDIWAFGCCLYEALAGKPAFGGATVTDILAAVVRAEPDWNRLPADTPFLVRRLLERCLAKDGSRRLHDIADARMDLTDSATVIPAADSAPKPHGLRLSYLLALCVAMLGLGALVEFFRERSPPESPVARLVVETGPLALDTWAVTFSRDGTKLVYVEEDESGRRLYLRHLDQDRAIPLPGTESARIPVFSPDGEWLAFVDGASGKLKKVSTRGGAAVTLCDYPSMSTFGIDWETEDRILFAKDDGIYVVPANGGEEHRLEVKEATSEKVLEFPRRPDVLPGGDAVLLTVGDFPLGQATALQVVETGERRILLENAVAARYVPTGHLVFLRDDSLYAVRFDLERLTVEGDPVPVLENVDVNITNGSTQYTFSERGSLAYVPGDWDRFRRKLVWVDRDGKVESIRSIPRRISGPSISPDGERIALTIFDKARGRLVDRNFAGDTHPLTPGEWSSDGVWSPNGESIAFTGMSAAGRTVFLKRLRGEEKAVVLGTGYNASWSGKGNVIAYQKFEKGFAFDIWTSSLEEDRTPQPFLTGPLSEGSPALSPDGQWLAYVSTESGNSQVYVRRLGKEGEKHQVSTESAMQPLWSSDGAEIFYRTEKAVVAVEVQTDPDFKASQPKVLFPDRFLWHDVNPWFRNYDISPDGQRFLMIESEEEPPSSTRIQIVLNWFEELKRLLPPER
jgi:eukaryotic-like serine/threonine-protein kinase